MKRLLAIAVLLTMMMTTFAQNDVTKFLGIPVDGTKSAMIQKLKEKGFTYNSTYGNLEGEFNGRDVTLSVVTNNNKVWRITLVDTNESNETDIKIRFNNLCRQFEKNTKYLKFSENQSIPDDEDISYKMLVDKKRYEAAYYQSKDTTVLANEIQQYALSKYTQEQIANPTEEIKKDIIMYSMDLCMKKPVWFMINEQYGRYRIIMYYDNEYNHSDGEDL